MFKHLWYLLECIIEITIRSIKVRTDCVMTFPPAKRKIEVKAC
jgi:hypothetical protein